MPRVSCHWPAEVQGPGGERFFGLTSEISGGGVGLLVDALAAIRLAPGGSILGPAAPVVRLVLHPSGGENPGSDIRLEGRVRHIRRLSQQQYLIGVHFVDPDSARRLVQRAITAGQGRPTPLSVASGERRSGRGAGAAGSA